MEVLRLGIRAGWNQLSHGDKYPAAIITELMNTITDQNMAAGMTE
jgi:hypothetical protein